MLEVGDRVPRNHLKPVITLGYNQRQQLYNVLFVSDVKCHKVSQLFERVGSMDERRRCVLCGKIVSNTRNHYYVHFPGQYSCSYCPAVYTRSDTLLLHMRTKHPAIIA